VDINTPKQVRFFNPLVKRLEAEGFEVLVTTRRFREVEQLARMIGLSHVPVGAYGGARLEDKLKASLSRSLRLLKVVKEWSPDLAISFSSPEAARVAYGLAIPHLCVNDSPHAEAVAKLTVPLSTVLFTPRFIPVEKWTKYGIEPGSIVQYDAIDPVAWLKQAPPPSTRRRRLIVMRAAEAYASYLDKEADVVERVAERLVEEVEGFKIVLLARYPDQLTRVKRLLRKVTVPTRVVDSVRLLSEACLFIGGGGTMTWEAALLGTPTISCTPVEGVDIEAYMASLGLIKVARGVEEAVAEALKTLEDLDRQVREQCVKARRALESMEDPVDVIAGFIEERF